MIKKRNWVIYIANCEYPGKNAFWNSVQTLVKEEEKKKQNVTDDEIDSRLMLQNLAVSRENNRCK